MLVRLPTPSSACVPSAGIQLQTLLRGRLLVPLGERNRLQEGDGAGAEVGSAGQGRGVGLLVWAELEALGHVTAKLTVTTLLPRL